MVVPKIEISKSFETRVFVERKLTTNFPCESEQKVKAKQNYIKVKTESISCTRVVTSKFKVLPTFHHVQMSNDPHLELLPFLFWWVPTKCLGNLWAIWNNWKCTNFSNLLLPNVPHSKLFSYFVCVQEKTSLCSRKHKRLFWKKTSNFDLNFCTRLEKSNLKVSDLIGILRFEK